MCVCVCVCVCVFPLLEDKQRFEFRGVTPRTPAKVDEGYARLYWDSSLSFSDIGGPKSYN